MMLWNEDYFNDCCSLLFKLNGEVLSYMYTASPLQSLDFDIQVLYGLVFDKLVSNKAILSRSLTLFFRNIFC